MRPVIDSTMLRILYTLALCFVCVGISLGEEKISSEPPRPNETPAKAPETAQEEDFALEGYSIKKVNHEFVDQEGNAQAEIGNLVGKALYQTELSGSKRVTGIRFFIHWGTPSRLMNDLTVRLDVRGLETGNTDRQSLQTFSQVYERIPNMSGWSTLDINGEAFKKMGRMMAWKVTLLHDKEVVASRKSFTWDDSFLSSVSTNSKP